MFELKDKTKVAVHPSSINFKRLQTSVRPNGKSEEEGVSLSRGGCCVVWWCVVWWGSQPSPYPFTTQPQTSTCCTTRRCSQPRCAARGQSGAMRVGWRWHLFSPLSHTRTHHKKQIYVYDSTFISPLALALFGGSFKLEWETDLDKCVIRRGARSLIYYPFTQLSITHVSHALGTTIPPPARAGPSSSPSTSGSRCA